MDEVLLNNLLSSLLIFSSIGFSLFTAVPMLKSILRTELESTFKKGPPRPLSPLFAYFSLVRFLEFVSYVYLFICLLVLATPAFPILKIPTYYACLGINVAVFFVLVRGITAASKKAGVLVRMLPEVT